MSKLLKNYSLSLALAVLFLGSLLLQALFQWQKFVSTQEAHGQVAELEEFTPEFLAATFENWQSEFLQLFTFVVLTTYLVHKGSPESKDGDEKKEKLLLEIKNKLNKGRR